MINVFQVFITDNNSPLPDLFKESTRTVKENLKNSNYHLFNHEECKDIIDWFWEVEDRHVDGAVYGRPSDVRQNHVVKDFKIRRNNQRNRRFHKIYQPGGADCSQRR